ncbi:hypothetical protein FZC79_19395 [Rossellomorea vietnamensis]|uniref:Uncharacterized protein n=3 Tax=Rossellomorea TaxID=2837508 RepID=A0A5D4K912_9BACI|nr:MULTISPECIES: hypothetical protein [Rossellomorea]TYR73235.1 hypothetical protein FZC79_19395 [Rossellomorea vietnamensis]TYS83188.1 hypothetical protein FZC80_02320 [Rossellomorea aquimaris]
MEKQCPGVLHGVFEGHQKGENGAHVSFVKAMRATEVEKQCPGVLHRVFEGHQKSKNGAHVFFVEAMRAT